MLVSVKPARDNKREPRKQGCKGEVGIRRDEGHGVRYGRIRAQTASQPMIPSIQSVVKLKQKERRGREAERGGGTTGSGKKNKGGGKTEWIIVVKNDSKDWGS